MNDANIAAWIKPAVLMQPAYSVALPQHIIKLNQNESPYDWPQQIKSEIAARLVKLPWNRYPAQRAENLCAKLAAYAGCEPEQILVGNGSNEILQAIVSAAIRPGDKTTTLSPTFAVYGLLTERSEGQVTVSQLDADFKLNVADLTSKCRTARLTFLASPNSPTGTTIPLEQIELVAQAATGLVVVDEAYFEFTGEQSAITLLKKCPNLIVTRTFSKAFGIAAFRFGYAVMASALARALGKCLLPFNLDVPTTVTAEAILAQLPLIQKQVRSIILERENLISRINGLVGYRAYPSQTNFFMLRGPSTAKANFNFLLESGILVRDISAYRGCEDLVRITVGTPEENRQLLTTLEAAL